MQATSEQHDAIHIHDRNLIVVAGAGSGKTRVLVERSIELLAARPEWPLTAVVAITFTRAAAQEMRERLRAELEARAAAAGGHWERKLAQLESARIDTIHGLCADILRANAAVAGVDPKFEVLDEVQAGSMLAEVVEDIRATIDAPFSQLFAYYDAYQIAETLNTFALVNFEDDAPMQDADALFQQWYEAWAEAVFAARDRLLAAAEAQALEQIQALPADDKLGALVLMYRNTLWQLRRLDDAEGIARLLEDCQRQGKVGNVGAAKAWGGKERKAEVAGILRALRGAITKLLKDIGEPPGELERLTARLLPLWQGLLKEIRDEYKRRKRERALLDFDDLERLCAELLEDEAVRARYRNAEFKQLLVDEFQDTNDAQWRVISALADLERGGSLFLVGDPKQSIYQFRGADVSVFNRVRAEFARHPARSELPLSTSFRSHQKLVAQCNALFRELLTRDAGGPVAEYQVAFDAPMQAFRQESPPAPAIELLLLDKEERDEAGAVIKRKGRRAERRAAADMRRWEAWEIASRIQALLAEERRIFDKETRQWRPLRYGDVALLFQALSQVTMYEDAFKASGIPYITIAGRGYYDRQEVWDMLALLRFLHNPADDLSLAIALRAPFFAFSDDLLFRLRRPSGSARATRPLPLWQALGSAAREPAAFDEEERRLLNFAASTLEELRAIAGRVTISELLRRALQRTQYLAILTGLPDGARRRGNIEKLLRLAEDSGKITLGKFSQYLTDLTARELREGEAPLEAGDAVRLMSVHASKGLEFPLVLLPDSSWRRQERAPILLADARYGLSCQVYHAASNKLESGFAHRRNWKRAQLQQEAERARLLYVAATRAQDYLIISGQCRQSIAGWTAKGWLGLLLPALGLEGITRQVEQKRQFAGGGLLLRLPSAPPPGISQPPPLTLDLWDFEAAAEEYPPWEPPLLQSLPRPAADERLQHITATQLAELGAWHWGGSQPAQALYGRRFRASALLSLATESAADTLVARTLKPAAIGRIAHELLRYEAFAADAAQEKLIKALAWQQGLTDAAAIAALLREVRALLERYRESDPYRWARAASAADLPVYRELPFLYRAGQRVIHGTIDLMLEYAPGAWRIVDYKSGAVPNGDFHQHAQRFCLQLGVYAAAAKAQFQLPAPPSVFVHYLRAGITVPLAAEHCRAALSQLDATVSALMAHDE